MKTDNGHADLENQIEFSFDDATIRRAFIRKVYMIITLIFTLGSIALVIFCDPVGTLAEENGWLMFVFIGVTFGTMCAIVCCVNLRRSYPTNYILLGVFTIAEAMMLAFIARLYAPETVMMAIGITAIVVFALTLFALQTKIDFTVCSGFMFAALIILLIFGIVHIFIRDKILSLIYCSLGVLVFSFYLVYDTQMMVGGDHKYSITPEDYVFAALSIYIDIANIFLYILSILHISNN